MSLELVTQAINTQAAQADAIDGSIKFALDTGVVLIDGTSGTNVVSNADSEADCTISTTIETLQQMQSGDLNPMSAVMGGQVRIEGNMGLAMKLQSILG